MRLLHVVGESRYGGAARIILRLGQIAQAEGWQVDVLTTDPSFSKPSVSMVWAWWTWM